jgi:adenosylmethionine-8-amino-7-oxononanoate aminotransferase
MSTATREQLEQWDRRIVWHAFTQMAEYEPWIVERGSGCYLIDLDGNRYLDGVSSLWCNIHGHRHPKLDAAVRAQLDRIAHCTSLGASSPTTIELARRLVDIAPAGLNHVFFSDDGATAVEVALKMAFQYWRQCPTPRPDKTRYVAFEAAYHGDTLGAVSVGGVARFRAMFEPLLFEVFQLPLPDPTRLPAGVAATHACEHYLADVATVLKEHHEQIAAVVIEPLVQAAAGMVIHPPGFLRGIRELTRRYGVLLIADEVAVGMGRTGTMFASMQEDVCPDLLCLAKGLTGGYLPLAATLATTEIFEAFLGDFVDQRTFFHGHTYGGNPLGAAASLATLEVFDDEATLAKLQPKIARLGEHLDRLADHPHVRSARQCGLIAAIELVRDKASDTPYPWQEQRGLAVCRRAWTEGVWLRPLRDVVVVMPPLAIEIEQLDQIMRAVQLGVDDLNV